jgi:hypothetical protein
VIRDRRAASGRVQRPLLQGFSRDRNPRERIPVLRS